MLPHWFKKITAKTNRVHIQILFLVVNIVFGLFGMYSFFYSFNLSQKLLVDQTQGRVVILERSTSNAVEYFVKNLIQSMNVTKKLDPVATLDVLKTREIFYNFVDTNNTPITGIARYDKDGKLVVIGNKERIITGENIVYPSLDFILWSKKPQNKDRYYLSNPYIALAGGAKGKNVMVLATPMYAGNRYTGTLATGIALDAFRDSFITPLTAIKGDAAFLVDDQGNIFMSDEPIPLHNILAYAQKERWVGYSDFIAIFKTLVQQEEGASDWIFRYPNQKPDEYVVASNRVDIPVADRKLFFIVLSSKKAIKASLYPLYAYGGIWLGEGIIVTFLTGLLIIIYQQISPKMHFFRKKRE